MRNSPGYIAGLFALIAGVAGYSYYDSDVQTLRITGKHMEEGASRRGIASSRYVIETNKGEYRLMTFPLIGFAFNSEEVYGSLRPGQTVRVRVGHFPPKLGKSRARPQIMSVY